MSRLKGTRTVVGKIVVVQNPSSIRSTLPAGCKDLAMLAVVLREFHQSPVVKGVESQRLLLFTRPYHTSYNGCSGPYLSLSL